MGVIKKTLKSQQSRLKMRLFFICLILYSANFVLGIPITNYDVQETVQAEEDLPMSDEISADDPFFLTLLNEVIRVGETLVENDFLGVGETLVENDLYPMVDAVGATKTFLKTAKKTFELLEDFVSEANENINNMNLVLKSLQQGRAQIQNDFSTKFNKAKSELRQVADRTVMETRGVKVLLEGLDESDDTFLLKAAIEKMKNLLVLSKDALSEAKEKYYLAIESFDNLNSSIQLEARYLEKLTDTKSSENKEWNAKAISSATGFLVADVFGCLGLCSIIGNLIVSGGGSPHSSAELEKLKTVTGDMLVSGQKINETMKEGISFLTEEIVLLNRWSNNVDAVSRNIDSYPQEYLKKIKAIRTVFINELNDLQTTACEFLNRGELFENNANTINIPELCRG